MSFVEKKQIITGFADIVGDLFHYNHINFLKTCKKYCDILIVGICSDDFCKDYKRVPILSQEERLYSASECKYVDNVILINTADLPITKDFMDNYNIDIVFHAHNIDESEKYNVYYEYPISINKFKRLNYNEGVSTSNLIKKIKNSY